MKTFGIRQAKAHLSQILRAAAAGECSLLTDNRKPFAMIGPPTVEANEAEDSPPQMETREPLSDAAAFRKALLGAHFPIQLDF